MVGLRQIKLIELKNPNGFTLIELVITFLIIAIVGVVALSPKHYLEQIRVTQAATKIKSDIRYTQSYALSSQKKTRIYFDASSNSYSVYYESSPGTWSITSDPLTKVNFTVNLGVGEYHGVSIVQANFDGIGNGLVFNAAGTPCSCGPGGGAVTVLFSQGVVTLNTGVVVTVEPNTGKVQ
ncbi:MAG: prepilin-type N-terminal cleavage/methylation domain-containing protein [Candidatus Omnitrophota bacterium]